MQRVAPFDIAGRLTEARTRMAAQLMRLDSFTFWILPCDGAGDFVVVGTTGAFLVAAEVATGTADVHRGRLRVDGASLEGHRRLRAEAKRLESTLSKAAVPLRVEPVICLTHAAAGAPRADRKVRVAPVRDLAKEIAGRPHTLPRLRAQRAARALGMRLDGDEKRVFIGGR